LNHLQSYFVHVLGIGSQEEMARFGCKIVASGKFSSDRKLSYEGPVVALDNFTGDKDLLALSDDFVRKYWRQQDIVVDVEIFERY
jgi:hypothetical protein